MNELYQKHAEWLIPALCVLVIFQTVMLLSNSGRQNTAVVQELPTGNTQVIPNNTSAAAQIQLVTQAATAVKGEAVLVEVWLKPVKALTLGGMDLVLKFDPLMVAINKVETGKMFSLVIPNRQSEKSGRLFITYLDESGQGVTVSGAVKLADVTLTAKQAGSLNLAVVSSSEGATTVLADKSSSNSLPFTAGNLVIDVTEK